MDGRARLIGGLCGVRHRLNLVSIEVAYEGTKIIRVVIVSDAGSPFVNASKRKCGRVERVTVSRSSASEAP